MFIGNHLFVGNGSEQENFDPSSGEKWGKAGSHGQLIWGEQYANEPKVTEPSVPAACFALLGFQTLARRLGAVSLVMELSR